MTTNIEDVEMLLKSADEANKALFDAAEQRNAQLLAEQAAAEAEREVAKLEYELTVRTADVAERLRQNRFDEESRIRAEADAKRDEEARQLRSILGTGEPEVREAEPQSGKDEPEPQASEPEVHVVAPVADLPHRPVESVNERTTVQPAVEIDTYSGRPSSGFELLLAVIGLLIGLAIAGNSLDSVFGDAPELVYWPCAIAWFPAWGALGFFSFGWFGWKLRHRN